MAGSVWEGRIVATHKLAARQVRVGPTSVVPPVVVVKFMGDNGFVDAEVRLEMRDGRPECTEVTFRAKPKGLPVMDADLARIKLEQLAVSTFATFAGELVVNTPTASKISYNIPAKEQAERDLYERQKATRPSRRAPTTAELEQVAEVYRENVDGRPVEEVYRQMGYSSQRTAARRIQQARAEGLLPPTTPGKRKA